MKQFDFVVQTSVGIHARPAMQLVNMTKKFQSDIKLSYNGNSANAKNIVSVLMLHANQGAEVVFLINGCRYEFRRKNRTNAADRY